MDFTEKYWIWRVDFTERLSVDCVGKKGVDFYPEGIDLIVDGFMLAE